MKCRPTVRAYPAGPWSRARQPDRNWWWAMACWAHNITPTTHGGTWSGALGLVEEHLAEVARGDFDE